MKKKTLIITITAILVIAIIVGAAVALSKKGGSENDLILPEAKGDKLNITLPDGGENADTSADTEEKVNASYDEFMEIYDKYENETDEGKKKEYLEQIQKILDSASK